MFVNPSSGHVRAIWKILAFGTLTAVGCVVLFLACGFAAGIAGMNPAELPAAFGWVIPAVALLIVTALVTRWFERQPASTVGIGFDRPWLAHLVGGLLLGGGMMFACWVAYRLLGLVESTWSAAGCDWSALAWGVVLCVCAGFSEELAFRGYAFQVLARWRMVFAIVAGGLLFMATHLGNPGGVAAVPIVNLFLAHVLFVVLFLRTRSLWLPIGVHVSWNFTEAFILGLAVSGNEMTGSVLTSTLQPGIWSGNEFGPEGGLVVTGALALAAALAWKLIPQARPQPDLISTTLPRLERSERGTAADLRSIS